MSCQNAIAIFNEKNVKGKVYFHQCNNKKKGLIVEFDFTGFKPNAVHAIHIHEYGDMSSMCDSLGSHLNLTDNDHGSIFIDIKDSHTGDLINNIHADVNGNFKYKYFDPRISIRGDVSKSIIGCSVIIHFGIDDLGQGIGDKRKESLKTGNAGGRMLCSIIGKAKDGKL